jgi:CspA family cold shock protein
VRGVIKALNVRGFGFITGEDGEDAFFHRSWVSDFDSMSVGDPVEFEQQPGDKGLQAKNIRTFGDRLATGGNALHADAEFNGGR